MIECQEFEERQCQQFIELRSIDLQNSKLPNAKRTLGAAKLRKADRRGDWIAMSL